MAEAFSISIDLAKFRKSFGEDLSRVVVGVNVGVAKATEEMLGLIKSEKLGPRKWNPRAQTPEQKSMSFAMAVKRAKADGYSDFGRGKRTGLKGRRGKKITIGAGDGWRRVLELQPRMATYRPDNGQSLWIQSGTLRKTTSYGAIGRGGYRDGTLGASVTLSSDALAIGFIQVTQAYGQQHEAGKYKFVEPAVREYLRTDELRKHIVREIARAIKESGAAQSALLAGV